MAMKFYHDNFGFNIYTYLVDDINSLFIDFISNNTIRDTKIVITRSRRSRPTQSKNVYKLYVKALED